jgi:hypothetical protein
LYTSGRYRSSSRLHRLILEPLFIRHDVDVAFSGHEHIYQRSALRQGIQYFVSGAAGSLRPGAGAPSASIATTFDDDYHFMLIASGFSRTGRSVRLQADLPLYECQQIRIDLILVDRAHAV